MKTDKKLAVGAAMIAGTTAYMAYVGASTSWHYYLTADDCRANAENLIGSRLRVSGRVAAGSLTIARDRSRASLALEAGSGRLPVVCVGPLPDNLTEDIDVLVEGRLDRQGVLQGTKLLTRCASKYEKESWSEAGGP